MPLERFSRNLVHDVFMEIEEPEDLLDFPVAEAVAPDARSASSTRRSRSRSGRRANRSSPASRTCRSPASSRTSGSSRSTTSSPPGTRSTTIVEQGEGTKQSPLDPEHDPAHYYRFAEIFHGKRLIPNPDAPPDAPPEQRYIYGGDPIPFDERGVLPVPANPKPSDYPAGSQAHYACNAFNYTYTSVLKSLHATFNGEPDSLWAAIGLMESLKLQALDLMAIPSGPGNAGPSFEYQPVSA